MSISEILLDGQSFTLNLLKLKIFDTYKQNLDCNNYDPIVSEIYNDHHNLLILDPEKAKKANGAKNKKIFNYYHQYLQNFPFEISDSFDSIYNHYGYRIKINVHDIYFNLEFEPFFFIIALYDLSSKKKISESSIFKIDFSSNKNFEFIYEISNPSEDIFLVIKIEKTLQAGELSDIIDPYTKINIDEKTKEKLRNGYNEDFIHLGYYRMPFAWTAINLNNLLLANTISSSQKSAFSNNRHYSLERGASLEQASGLANKKKLNFNNDRCFNSTVNSPRLGQETPTIYNESPAAHRIITSQNTQNNASISPSSSSNASSRNSFPNMSISSPISPNCCDYASKDVPANNHKIKLQKDHQNAIVHSLPQYCPLCINEGVAKFAHFADFKPFTLTLDTLFRQESDKYSEEDLFKILGEFKKTSSAAINLLSNASTTNYNPGTNILNTSAAIITTYKKLGKGLIPCKLLINFSPGPIEDVCGNASNMQQAISQQPSARVAYADSPQEKLYSSPQSPSSNLLMAELPTTPILHPHLKATPNYLFIYPKRVNFGAFKSTTCSARNITLKVELLRNEVPDQSSRMFSFIDKYASYEVQSQIEKLPRYKSSYTCTVLYHNKCPDFMDEIKVELPHDILEEEEVGGGGGGGVRFNKNTNYEDDVENVVNGDWHLLFTFFHVKCGNFSVSSNITNYNNNTTCNNAYTSSSDRFSTNNVRSVVVGSSSSHHNHHRNNTRTSSDLSYGADSVLTFLGCTWLPLKSITPSSTAERSAFKLVESLTGLVASTIKTGEFSLPICLDKFLPDHYSNIHPHVALPCIKWLDGHKNLFELKLELLVSSRLSPDPNLNLYTRLSDKISRHLRNYEIDKFRDFSEYADAANAVVQSNVPSLEKVLIRVLDALKEIHVTHLLPFAYEILDYLIRLYLARPIPTHLDVKAVRQTFLQPPSSNFPLSSTISNYSTFYLSPQVFDVLAEVIDKIRLHFALLSSSKTNSNVNPTKQVQQKNIKELKETSTSNGNASCGPFTNNVNNIRNRASSSSVTNVYTISRENLPCTQNHNSSSNLINNSILTPQMIPRKLLAHSKDAIDNKLANLNLDEGPPGDDNTTDLSLKTPEMFFLDILKSYISNFDVENYSKNEEGQTCTRLVDSRCKTSPKYSENNKTRLIHEELCLQFVVCSGKTREKAFNNAIFFLGLLGKTMKLHYESITGHGGKDNYKGLIFTQPFLDDLSSLYNMVIADICQKGNTLQVTTILNNSTTFIKLVELNFNLATFTRNLLDLLESKFVLKLIQSYYEQIDAKIQILPDPLGLIVAKLDFTHVITNYSGYLNLNLSPSFYHFHDKYHFNDNDADADRSLKVPPSRDNTVLRYYFEVEEQSNRTYKSNQGDDLQPETYKTNQSHQTFVLPPDHCYFDALDEKYRNKHPYASFVLLDLVSLLDSKFTLCLDKAICNIVKLLAAHDFNKRLLLSNEQLNGSVPRFASPKPPNSPGWYSKPEVAKLYFPLFGIALSCISQLNDNFGKKTGEQVSSKSSNRNSRNSFGEFDLINVSPMVSMFYSPNSRHSLSSNYPESLILTNRTPLSRCSRRSLLMCLAWVLYNVPTELIKVWWARLTFLQLGQFLELLYLMIINYELNFESDKNDFNGNNETPGQIACSLVTENLKTRLEQAILGNQNARSEYMAKRKDCTGITTNTTTKGFNLNAAVGGLVKNYNSKTNSLRGSETDLSNYGTPAYNNETCSNYSGDNSSFSRIDFSSATLRWKRGNCSNTNSVSQSNTEVTQSSSVMGKHPFCDLQDYWLHGHHIKLFATTRYLQSLTTTDSMYLESKLCEEISLIVLNTLELFVEFLTNHEYNKSLIMGAMRIVLKMLSSRQSTSVYEYLFATQRAIINKYSELFFEEETEICYDLCKRFLFHASSAKMEIRSQASASIYHLMFKNNEIGGNNFALVKMATTMAISSILGSSSNAAEYQESLLRRSLDTILEYTDRDSHMRGTSFPNQVKCLIQTLDTIITDTEKMKEHGKDKEMLVDLMYRIADNYKTSPDLRLTWLQNMAAKHSQNNNHSEAAQCLIHSAAMVNEYLQLMEHRSYLPIGAVAYQPISTNVIEETVLIDFYQIGSSTNNGIPHTDIGNNLAQRLAGTNSHFMGISSNTYGQGNESAHDANALFNPKYFSEIGLVGLLEQAASSFTMAGEYEIVNEVYKLILPIHEFYADAKKLASIHGKLHEIFTKMVQREEGLNKRVLIPPYASSFGGATYFRIGFYGHRFGSDVNGCEFIYREPAITKLSEITHRLLNFYGAKFGESNVECIKDSNKVNPNALDPVSKAYVQITYVEPYFDISEQSSQRSPFYATYNLRRFVFSTPFTLLGDKRVHGQLQEQYKRKTILTTEYAFPYVKTRIRVVDWSQTILCPIEVAIEDIEKKCNELVEATQKKDPKILAMVLQGSLGPTVNQGPLLMANTFLLPVIEGREEPTIFHNKLRICFKLFMHRCKEALTQNLALIEVEQRDYHKQLENNFRLLNEQLSAIINNKITLNYVNYC